MKNPLLLAVVAVAMLTGCSTDYSWRPRVPSTLRTVAVPSFRNESALQEFGAVATRQVLRELQREGTFAIRAQGDSALEIQGIVRSVSAGSVAYNRRTWMRMSALELTARVEVSVIDKQHARVLIDNRTYLAKAQTTAMQDLTTAERDAAGRLADDLARQVVDDLLNLKF